MVFQGALSTGPPMPVAVAKSQFPNVLQGLTNPSVSMNVDSPCATATIKRTRNETSSIGGNTLVGSHVTDSSYQDTKSKPEDGSDSDPDTNVTTKLESSSSNHGANEAARVGPSPSKANKAKL